jgi:hypothetical protein
LQGAPTCQAIWSPVFVEKFRWQVVLTGDFKSVSCPRPCRAESQHKVHRVPASLAAIDALSTDAALLSLRPFDEGFDFGHGLLARVVAILGCHGFDLLISRPLILVRLLFCATAVRATAFLVGNFLCASPEDNSSDAAGS